MKPFDLEAAKAGAPFARNDGMLLGSPLHFIGTRNTGEALYETTGEGGSAVYISRPETLHMLPRKVTRWVNLYGSAKAVLSGIPHRTEARANDAHKKGYLPTPRGRKPYITTIAIELEVDE